ncbi:SDR family NAD(P)-dependent oxidoreductase [Amedibacillus sp. YH-ame10]
MELNKICCVVTGGTRGIGAAIAKEFAAKKARIAIFGRDEVKAKQTLEEIRSVGGEAIFYKVDVCDENQVRKATKEVVEKFGYINAWVNSAGISIIMPFLEMSIKDYDAVIDTNLKGTFICCQVAIEEMMKRREGNIINISSLSGKKASAWQSVYCASKFGVQGLTQSIAREFADQGIRLNCICPGAVDTDIWNDTAAGYARKRNIREDEVLDYFRSSNPMRRLSNMKDITEAALFLLSDRSSYLTGQSIVLSGGEWMD